jgi:hypothetical protein
MIMSNKGFALALICLLIPTQVSLARPIQDLRRLIDQTAPSRTSDKTEKPEDIERRAELEKKGLAVLDQVIKEIPGLHLPENRIRLQAAAADVIWDRDQKRARALFKQATDGLADLQRNDAPPARNASEFDGVGVSTEYLQNQWVSQARIQLRQEVLNLISRHDARLALDFLRATRLAPADAGAANQLAYADRFMELNLATQIAESDPQEALKIAEKSLENGFTYDLPNLVSRLATKDKDAAGKLASEIVAKLRNEDLTRSGIASSVALSLLGIALGRGGGGNEAKDGAQTTALDESIARDLMEMVTSALLKLSDGGSGSEDGEDDNDLSEGSPIVATLRQMLPEIQQYDPTHYAAIKATFDQMEKHMSPEEKAQAEYQKLAATGSADQLIAAAENASGQQQKDMLYSQAASKALGEGDADRARQIAREHISDPNRQRAILASINQQSLWKSAAQGRLDEARPMLARMPPDQRATALLSFVGRFLAQGDKKTALQLLEEARELVRSTPASFTQVQAEISIAAQFATLDPTSSFELLEPLTDQFNVLLSALETIDGFEYGRHFREGELMNQSSGQIVSQSFQCARLLSALSRSDFDRARACAERFQRPELRTTALLSVAQGVLSNGAKGPGGVPWMRPAMIRGFGMNQTSGFAIRRRRFPSGGRG